MRYSLDRLNLRPNLRGQVRAAFFVRAGCRIVQNLHTFSAM